MILKSTILEGFRKAKMESKIDVGGLILTVCFACVLVLICDRFLEAPEVENRVPVETKRSF